MCTLQFVSGEHTIRLKDGQISNVLSNPPTMAKYSVSRLCLMQTGWAYKGDFDFQCPAIRSNLTNDEAGRIDSLVHKVYRKDAVEPRHTIMLDRFS